MKWIAQKNMMLDYSTPFRWEYSSKKRARVSPRNGIMLFAAPKFNGYISLSEKNKANFSKRIRNLCVTFRHHYPLVTHDATQVPLIARRKKTLNAVQITDTV